MQKVCSLIFRISFLSSVHTAIRKREREREREREGGGEGELETERDRETKIPSMFVGWGGQSSVIETKTLGKDFICSKQLSATWNVSREISGIRRVADENCALLGYYTVVIPYRCFGATYRPHFKGQEAKKKWNKKQTIKLFLCNGHKLYGNVPDWSQMKMGRGGGEIKSLTRSPYGCLSWNRMREWGCRCVV